MARKTATLLNQLRLDVETVLAEIQQAGTDVDGAAYDLSKVIACDLKSDDKRVKGLYDNCRKEIASLNKLLYHFKNCRDKYLEFF